jgi:hypothetical protein
MNPLDRHRQNYTPEPEAAPPLWQQAAGLILAAVFVYLFAVFCLSF